MCLVEPCLHYKHARQAAHASFSRTWNTGFVANLWAHIAKPRVKSHIIGKTGSLFLGNVQFQPVWNHMYLTIAVTSHTQNNNSEQKTYQKIPFFRPSRPRLQGRNARNCSRSRCDLNKCHNMLNEDSLTFKTILVREQFDKHRILTVSPRLFHSKWWAMAMYTSIHVFITPISWPIYLIICSI